GMGRLSIADCSPNWRSVIRDFSMPLFPVDLSGIEWHWSAVWCENRRSSYLGKPDMLLVTGGAGFIGSHLIDRLLARGEEILCVDDFNDFYDPAIKRRNIAEHLKSSRYRLLELDIR